MRDHRQSLLHILAFSGTEEGTLAGAKYIGSDNTEIAQEAIRVFQYVLNVPDQLTPALRQQVLPFMAAALDNEELKHSAAWWIIKSEHLAIQWPDKNPSGAAGDEVTLARDRAVQSVKAWLSQHKN